MCRMVVVLVLMGLCVNTAAALPGSGTEADPWRIESLADFDEFAADANYWADWTRLETDVNLAGRTYYTAVIAPDTSSNSGFQGTAFTGVFDGNDHKITNFKIVGVGKVYLGLFGDIDNGELRDLGIEGGSVRGGCAVGGLVGVNSKGSISNCYSTGDVSGIRDFVGGLVGVNSKGSISNCYSTAFVSGIDWYVGGLVGYNDDGSISNCYSTGDVSGDYRVGGLVGQNLGIVSSCYSTGDVSGNWHVGGLVGINYLGNVSNCYSTGDVSGHGKVAGLVGENDRGNVSNCYSTGYVSATARDVGGLVGVNTGSVSNCYSTGYVSGDRLVGGLVGRNTGSVSNCYSTGDVNGVDNVGGLVGGNSGSVSNCFWDTDMQTHGVTESIGDNRGTATNVAGLPTAQMQTKSTFTDAGWDFVGETINGIDDIWFLPQGDYPHLWWEGMEASMKLTPRTLNCRSYGNWVKAHLTLPEGFTVADVDSNRPAVLHSFGFESAPLYVSVNENELVQIEAAFEREVVCSLAGDWPQALTVAGFLTDGNIFLGTSKVRMITPGLKEIEELALYWLNADCVQPDFCDGIDMNRDSMVNLLDYALLLNSQVEFVSE